MKRSDLFILERATGVETRLTTTGADHVFNGKLDWVYEEELANRRGGRSYEWAPDSSAIAYLRLDENRVPAFPVVDFTPANGKVLPQRYPKAGDPNAIPSVHVVDLDGKETASFAPAPDDVYVAPQLAWTADGKQACFLVLDRPQTTLDVCLLPLGSAKGSPRNPTPPGTLDRIPHFLADGTFLFRSERTGFKHLYPSPCVGRDGGQRRHEWQLDDRRSGPGRREGGRRLVPPPPRKTPQNGTSNRANLDGTGFQRVAEEMTVRHSLTLSPTGAFH